MQNAKQSLRRASETQVTYLRLPADQSRRIRRVAKARGETTASLIRQLVREFLSRVA